MKNDFIVIILSNSVTSSESNCELNNKLITEFECNRRRVEGLANCPIFAVAIKTVGTPIFFPNGSSFGSHFIIKELAEEFEKQFISE